MLVRDHLGYFYDVPDSQLYGVQQVGYDGLGNPVGFPLLAALGPLISGLAPALTSALPAIAGSLGPAVGSLIGGLFGGRPAGMAGVPGAEPAPALGPAPTAMPEQASPTEFPASAPLMMPLPEMAPCPACEPCPVCPVCGTPAEAMMPGAVFPMPVGMRPPRLRRRRRLHAYPR
jgi:hypothetical protein